jgi:hypothetical protein
MKSQEIKQIKKAIKGLRKIRRNLPKEFSVEEIEAISYALDYLEEELFKMKLNNHQK